MESHNAEGTTSLDRLTWANFTLESNRTAKMLDTPEIIEHLADCTQISSVLNKIKQLSTQSTLFTALVLREAIRVAIVRQSLPIDNLLEYKIAEPLITLIRDSPEIAHILFKKLQQELVLGRIDVAYSFRILLGMSLFAGVATKVDTIPGVLQAEVESTLTHVDSVYIRIQEQANLQYQPTVVLS